MKIKYDINIDNEVIKTNLKRITNQIYKLLPMREEGLEWRKPLSTLIEELAGMNRLFIGQFEVLFSLLCKMEGLFVLTEEDDFQLFRRTIFECLTLINTLGQCVN
jgi:hypothetical protein